MAALVATLAVSALGCAVCVAADVAPPALRLRQAEGANGSVTFDVLGLPSDTLAKLKSADLDRTDWAALFAVYAGDAGGVERGDLPAMLGTWRVEADILSFVPRFPLAPGLTYTAVFDPRRLPGAEGLDGSESRTIVAKFSTSQTIAEPTTVVRQIFPSGERLPENLLKFYVHFSAPMSRGNIYRHVHLMDDSGGEVELPFLELDEQLWDRRQTRITLLLDPGRIKRGLKPHEDVGAALMAGRSYTLVIDADWPDAEGNPLVSDHRKRFKVGEPDRTSPDPMSWHIEPPRGDSRDPLIVTFAEPLDQALLSRVLQVRDALDQEVAGKVMIDEGETRWQFVPEQDWRRGSFRLVVDTVLEDLAGNSIGRAFEVDLTRQVQQGAGGPRVDLPFTVGEGSPAR